MLVTLAFHQGDIEKAINLLVWILELERKQHDVHRCLLVGDHGMPVEQWDRIKAAAYQAFGTVFTTDLTNPETRGWPFGPNAMFAAGAAYNRLNIREDFLWLEPDAIPLKRGWLDALQKEYKEFKQPFMGAIHTKPWRHMTGCGIYPWELYKYNPQMLMANETPFDVIDPQQTIFQMHQTKQIQHVWSWEGDKLNSKAPTFPTKASTSVISPDAVMFHRCKDHTLIDRLRGRPSNSPIYIHGDTIIVQLGRYGDILNILPVCKRISEQYGKPTLMVAKQFSDLLDAVPYVHKYVYDGNFGDVEKAVELAQSKFQLVVTSQVWGHSYRVPHLCESYNMESWRMAGFLPHWADADMVLELDVPNRVNISLRPSICVCLSSGFSSPFKQWLGVQESITRQFSGEFDIVDLAQMHCDRIYDLLRWMRSARIIITSDTAILHLASACKTPVIALVNDDPWLGSTPRCNCILRLRYADVLGRLGEINELIKKHSGFVGGVKKMIGVMA